MGTQCEYGLKDSIFLLNKITRRRDSASYTVAAFNDLEPEKYDFKSLIEALEWLKQEGSIIHSINGVHILLGPGDHYIKETDILQAGFIHDYNRNQNIDGETVTDPIIAFFKDLNVTFEGSKISPTTIIFDSINQDIVFVDSIIDFSNIKIKTKDTNLLENIGIVGERSCITVAASQLEDIVIIGEDNSIVRTMKVKFLNNNNNNEKIIMDILTNSFGYIINCDMLHDIFSIYASDNSKIAYLSNTNDENVTFDPLFNYVGYDSSLIYDQNTTLRMFGYQGTTAGRPTLKGPSGMPYLDTDLNKPIWFNGTNWIDATGSTV